MTYFAYLRKSTKKQEFDRQYKQLMDFCTAQGIKISPNNIITESRTGKNFDRPKLKQLADDMQSGDCLILIDVARAGRTYAGTLEFFHKLKEKNISFVVATCPLLDTRKKDDNPATALVVDIVLATMTWLADEERRQLLEKTSAGREAAKDKGVKFGRHELTFNDLPKEFLKVVEKATGNETKTELLNSINGALIAKNKKKLSRGTFYNYLKIYYNSKG